MKKLAALAVFACLFPLAMQAIDQQYYISFATRILIYVLMAAVLFFRPQGLFPARG